MNNNTIKSYKIAVKAKYEMEKNGDNCAYLSLPSQANLRKLCWQNFENNKNQNDLNVFKAFFGFAFDLTQKNIFTTKTDRFKPVGAFFRGETESPTDDVVEIAAILVDFNPRPLKNFRSVLIANNESSVSNQNELLLSETGKLLCEREIDVVSEKLNPIAFFLDFKNRNFEGKIKSWKQIIIRVSVVFF